MVVRRNSEGELAVEGENLGVLPPVFEDAVPHWGVVGKNVYASVPVADGAWITVMQPSPTRGSLGRVSATLGFLQSVWWQFLLAGSIAAVIALVMARWLARGMTQPLRDMAAAARRMETGDYSRRVYTTSRDEVGQLAAAFNRMSQELENLEASRRELVANVSHELKTPITAIRAHLENLLDGVEQPNPETLQVMLAQSERLGRLVEQLLELSKLESGEVRLRREDVPLAPVVRQVLSEIDMASADREVDLTSDVPDDLPTVEADRERVHQVLFNLVDNAVRFTPAGGQVRIEAHRRERLGRDQRRRLRRRDRRRGSAPLVRAVLPRRSSHVRVRTAAPASGSRSPGRWWRRTAAHISAESELGEGSVFTFDLPVATATEGRSEP